MHLDPTIITIDPNGDSVENQELVCGDFGDAFSSQDDFLSHCQQHRSKFACFICKERFTFLKELRVHVEWHNSTEIQIHRVS